MGTNYYHYPSGERDCPHCGQETPHRHIGKSSGGWNFSLRIYPHDGIASLDDWQAVWAKGGAIFDEYGERVSVEQMLDTIVNRSWPGGRLRSHVGLTSNIGSFVHTSAARYGGPTWDLCDYEFS